MDADGVPRVLDIYAFRNSIRRQYRRLTNRMQIAKLTMMIWPEDSGEDREPTMWDLFTFDWDILVDDLIASSGQVDVKVKLWLLDEDDDHVLECPEPPAHFHRFFSSFQAG